MLGLFLLIVMVVCYFLAVKLDAFGDDDDE